MHIRKIKLYFSSGKVLYDRKLALILWFGLSLFAAIQALLLNKINNFIIYTYVYVHTLKKVNLYLPYPTEYGDVNLYGPLFSVIIAPFTWMPDKLGALCWVIANIFFLFFAFNKLPIPKKWKTAMLLLCSHELMNTSSWLQTNSLVCACLLLGFVYVHEEKESRALFFIMIATFIKLYGIAGLAFLVFSKKPLRFIGWAIIWSVAFFFAPLLITSFSFLIQSYQDWYAGLKLKAAKNTRLDINNFYQDISVMGFIRRIFRFPKLNDALVIIPSMLLFVSQYSRYKYFEDIRFRLYLLSSVMIATVIFSTSSESPTYIIALPGICLWYLLQPKTRKVNIFFGVMFFITTFSYSDLLTPWLREHIIRPYSIKVVPSLIVWLIILIQIHTKQFLKAYEPFETVAL